MLHERCTGLVPKAPNPSRDQSGPKGRVGSGFTPCTDQPGSFAACTKRGRRPSEVSARALKGGVMAVVSGVGPLAYARGSSRGAFFHSSLRAELWRWRTASPRCASCGVLCSLLLLTTGFWRSLTSGRPFTLDEPSCALLNPGSSRAGCPLVNPLPTRPFGPHWSRLGFGALRPENSLRIPALQGGVPRALARGCFCRPQGWCLGDQAL